jgi:hypothetical protein
MSAKGQLVFVPLLGSTAPVGDWRNVMHRKTWGLMGDDNLIHVLLCLRSDGTEACDHTKAAEFRLFDAELAHLKVLSGDEPDVPDLVFTRLAQLALCPETLVRED